LELQDHAEHVDGRRAHEECLSGAENEAAGRILRAGVKLTAKLS
jgi:hypothetical protein